MNWLERLLPSYPTGSKNRALTLNSDAFSDGQIGSKLWLCRELEAALSSRRATSPTSMEGFTIRVLAGWYGLLPFLLLSRERIAISRLELFDLDPEAVRAARAVNDHWALRGLFSAECRDVNELSEAQSVDVVINTSCEHFTSLRWWDLIPAGTVVALQGTDMPHVEHVRSFRSLAHFQAEFGPWGEILFSGQMNFDYPGLKFSRFQLIGIKG